MNITRVERALLSLCGLLMGTRSTGTALVHATGADVDLPVNSYGVPVITSVAGSKALDFDRLVKTTAAATVTAAGVSVPIASVLGGARATLVADVPIRWLPELAGVEAESLVEAAGIVTGVSRTSAPLVKRVTVFEGIGGREAADALWRGAVGDFPAIVISWEGSSSGEKGRGAQTKRARTFRAYVIVSRTDGMAPRRDEGKELLDQLEGLLCDRSSVDGEVFSVPPISLTSAGRLPLAPTAFVYWQEFQVFGSAVRQELRTFTDWLTVRETLITPRSETYPTEADALTIADQTQDIP